ncbi:MAG: DUF177 domain-containing protein [Eggerthellaceae bacterium]|nr:DUF177 domain-containing protein [Eggerthellaceae bacterium]
MPPDHKIDLQPLLHGALLLELPLVALCKDDCAGLCHICGENKNIHMCTCNEQAALDAADEKNAENPFAVLRNLDFSE